MPNWARGQSHTEPTPTPRSRGTVQILHRLGFSAAEDDAGGWPPKQLNESDFSDVPGLSSLVWSLRSLGSARSPVSGAQRFLLRFGLSPHVALVLCGRARLRKYDTSFECLSKAVRATAPLLGPPHAINGGDGECPLPYADNFPTHFRCVGVSCVDLAAAALYLR